MKSLLRSYKKALAVIGRVNTILILSIVYWTVLPIFTLFLNFKRESVRQDSSWRKKEPNFKNSHEQQF